MELDDETDVAWDWLTTAAIERWAGATLADVAVTGELAPPSALRQFAHRPAGPRPELAVRLVERATMRALNLHFRGRDKPTNVLSFPCDLPTLVDIDPDVAVTCGTDGFAWLGDLVLCPAVLQQEAAEQGKTLASHAAHLVVHGVLHLLGDDHEDEAEALAMETREIRILSSLGIADPYRHPVND